MKIKRAKPISRKLLLPMGLLLITEILLLVGSIFGGGLIDHMEQNQQDILHERVINRKTYLENQLISSRQNLSSTAQSIVDQTQQYLNSEGLAVDLLDDGSEHCVPLLLNISNSLIALMRSAHVTGVFVVFNTDDLSALEAAGQYINKPGLYIRDFDPVSNYNERNLDLLLEYAPTEVVQSLNISTDSAWRPQFEFARNQGYDAFLYKPYQTAYTREDAPTLNPLDLGYWSQPYCLDGDDKEAVSFSMPLILDDGTVCGVLGIEFTVDYLKSLLPYSEIGENKNGSYILGIETDNDQSYRHVVINGPIYAQMAGSQLSSHVAKTDDYSYIDNVSADTMICSVEYLNLYDTNTPFANERWALIGTVSRQNLFSFAHQIISTLLSAILLTLLVGIGGNIFIGYFISKPVISLAKSVKTIDPSTEITLQRTGIREIDTLVGSLEVFSQEVIRSAAKLSYIINTTSIRLAVFELNRQEQTLYVSDKFYDLFHINGQTPSNMTAPEFDQLMNRLDSFRQNSDDPSGVYIYKIPLPDDEDFPFRYVRLTTTDDGVHCIGLVEDITSATLEKENLERERDYDLLTGLMNRRAFNRKINELFEQGSSILKIGALIMMDLDNLKYINDTYGHDYGDLYIKTTADCLYTYTPKSTMVARFAGDEFFLFFYGYDSQEEVRQQIQALKKGIDQTELTLPDRSPCGIKISGGIAWYPADSTTYEQLLRYADFAMYRVKHSVKGAVGDFDLAAYNMEAYLMQNKAELNQLIEKQAVDYYFQPIVSVETGTIFAYEALMRSQMPTLRMPNEIFTLAKMEFRLNEMETITWFKAMEAYTGHIQSGAISTDCKIFINSIPNYLLPQDQLQEFEGTYETYLPNIVMEITEEEEQQEDIREQKKDMLTRWGGFVALDDYGSGYNSEKALLSLTPHYIKVDISIIRGIHEDRDKQKILENIISYAHERGMKIIAEGVETLDEAKTVIQMGADYIQGYLVAKPALIPPRIPDNIRQFILEQRPAAGND